MIRMREAAYGQPRYHSALFKQLSNTVVSCADRCCCPDRGDASLDVDDASMNRCAAGG